MKKSPKSSKTWATRAAGLLLVLASCASGAKAQEGELPDVSGRCAPSVKANRRAVLDHDGETGVWLHGAVAECMAGRLELLPEFADRVALLERRRALSDERHALAVRRAELAERQAEKATQALDDAIAARQAAEQELDAWYRAPALWVVVGVGASALAVWGAGQLDGG